MHARSLRILVVLAAPGVAFPADAATRALAAARVAGAERHHVGSEAVKKAIDSAPEGAAVDALISACRKAATEAGAGSRAASILTAAIESAGTQDGAEAAATLRGALKRVRAMVSFQPVFESDRPTDFPSLTPVGTIQVKSYPVHRAATARSPAEGGLPRNLLFWQLFGHIKKNDIAMTAPVVMDYARDDGAGTAMSFLYASTDIGKTGADGLVQVRDVEPMLVVSAGVRGPYSRETRAEALERIDRWLEANADEFRRAGPPRVLAYNSPRVPDSDKYSEVQVPVERIESRKESF